MLSVIVHGRNDSSGGNLHKRAALGLNCLAHMLDAETDEIIFVDYGTPDTFSTFVEAIQDTLTDQAKQRLRVLRVRSAAHDQWEAQPPAMHAVASNVGARRSKASSRWLLFCDAGAIPVPQEPGRSLSAIVSALNDELYALPCTDLPTIYWETLDRFDPSDAIRRLGQWGTHFGPAAIRHDAAEGDRARVSTRCGIRLISRNDFFAVGGFDEAIGSIERSDLDITCRLRSLRGQHERVVEQLSVYFCAHSAQRGFMPGADSLDTGQERADKDATTVSASDWPDRWGLAEKEIEEFTLDRGQATACLGALESLLQEMPVTALESRVDAESYNDLSYSPEHVLPYLASLLSTMPRHWSMAYLGCRSHCYRLVAATWRALGFTGDLILPTGFEHLGSGLILPESAAYARATLVLAEFGYGSADEAVDAPESSPQAWNTPDAARLTRTKMVFENFLAAEAKRAPTPDEPPRYFIAINAIHNLFQDTVNSNISAYHTQFSSRLRHGHVVPFHCR